MYVFFKPKVLMLEFNLSKLRNKKGLTEKELSLHMGVDLKIIKQIESGERQPDLDFIAKTMRVFGINKINKIIEVKHVKVDDEFISSGISSAVTLVTVVKLREFFETIPKREAVTIVNKTTEIMKDTKNINFNVENVSALIAEGRSRVYIQSEKYKLRGCLR